LSAAPDPSIGIPPAQRLFQLLKAGGAMVSNDGKGVAVWVGLNAGGFVFLGVWAYGIASNDWLLGLVFGWIPAVIMGVIAGLVVYGFTHALSRLVISSGRRSESPSAGPATGPTIRL
jgi:hypothetical protein